MLNHLFFHIQIWRSKKSLDMCQTDGNYHIWQMAAVIQKTAPTFDK